MPSKNPNWQSDSKKGNEARRAMSEFDKGLMKLRQQGKRVENRLRREGKIK